MFEDQMNEAKSKVEELQRQLNETNTQRARAQAESGNDHFIRSLTNRLVNVN